jgi:site-specific recombinase XerD
MYENQQVFDFSGLNVADAHRYVVKGLDIVSVSSKGRIIISIRNFFRFLQFTGNPVPDYICKIPLSPAVWKHLSFPSTLDSFIFSRLHEIPKIETAAGKRDRVVILYFTEPALRCNEVASFTLDNFDCYSGQVKICNTKKHRDGRLSLSAVLGNTIVLYLKEARLQNTVCQIQLYARDSNGKETDQGCCTENLCKGKY